jgi:hypothetical protein
MIIVVRVNLGFIFLIFFRPAIFTVNHDEGKLSDEIKAGDDEINL